MNLIGFTILSTVICVVLFAPRRWALVGMMAGVLYVTQGQVVELFGINMYAHRFMEVAGLLRVLHRREFSFANLNQIDRAFVGLYAYTTIVFLLRSRTDQAYQLGIAVDAILCYVTFRALAGNVEDFQWFLRAFLLLLAPYTALVLFESFTQQNPFASMGGVELSNWMREGRLRCQGSFRHGSLLGSLGATFLPLYIGLMFAKTYRLQAGIGLVLCVLIVWASNSGGPLNTAAIGVVGWLMWRMRTEMRLFRRLLVAGIAVMALIMKAPIWYLPAKISSITGGDGWHRSYLMDIAFQNLSHWWLAGMPVLDTADWFPYHIQITGASDITNEYLSFGIAAGLIAMALFIRFLVLLFKNLGRAMAWERALSTDGEWNEPALWSLGVMLTGHIFNWLGITYFDQFHLVWFMQAALIVNLTESCLEKEASPAEEFDGEPSGDELVESGKWIGAKTC